MHWEVYEPVITPHPLFFTLNDQDSSGLVEICHRAMSENCLGSGHELFHYGKTAERMYFVGRGTLDYMSGQDPMRGGDQRIEVHANQWVSEMVLWMNWIHRGTVTGQTNAELVELDAKKFHEHVRHRGFCFDVCRQYARLYVQRIASASSSDEDLPPDTWGHVDDLQVLVHQTNEGLHRIKSRSVAGVLSLLVGVFTEKDLAAQESDGGRSSGRRGSWGFGHHRSASAVVRTAEP
uniref:Cyclic nucleotide-binding domain-containing protein n=1 Tax=Alexandrium catenella TaxID=2925 RepID=A0A7S1RER1_ALECA